MPGVAPVPEQLSQVVSDGKRMREAVPATASLEPELQLVAQVGAAIDALPAAAAEDVAEHLVEDVPKSRAAREPRAAGVHPGMTELVVGRTLALIGQNVVGLLRLLELLFGRTVVGIPIGMKLHRLTAVCLLEIRVAGVARHAQHVVVVPFRHASPLPAVRPMCQRGCTSGRQGMHGAPCRRKPPGDVIPVAASYLYAGDQLRKLGQLQGAR